MVAKRTKSAMAYGFFAFFLGIFGVHKFYANKPGQGILILLLGLLGWFTFIVSEILIVAEEPVAGFVLMFFIGLPALMGVGAWCITDGIIGMCNIRTPEKIFGKK